MAVYEREIEVRYAETDQMGVVYHANYLIWFELGRSALLTAHGLDYGAMEQLGFVSPVISVEASYLSPVRYRDAVIIKTKVQAYDGLRITYAYEIWVQERLCVTGSSIHVCVRKEGFRPVSIRRTLPQWHAVYEKIKHS